MTTTPAAKARYARYRKRRRERLGEDADKLRQRQAAKKSNAKHRQRLSIEGCQRRAREAAAIKKRHPAPIDHESASPGRIITARELRLDCTRWVGPGARREIELERQADKILQNAADAENRGSATPQEAPGSTISPPHDPQDQPQPEGVTAAEILSLADVSQWIAHYWIGKVHR